MRGLLTLAATVTHVVLAPRHTHATRATNAGCKLCTHFRCKGACPCPQCAAYSHYKPAPVQ